MTNTKSLKFSARFDSQAIKVQCGERGMTEAIGYMEELEAAVLLAYQALKAADLALTHLKGANKQLKDKGLH